MATNNKYDRQLRLWGASGQKALGETCVVLLRATAAGTETVKNLVLPGVGSFLIVDDVAQVTSEHASNFFLEKQEENSSKSRAEVACELLQELNPDVQGAYQHVAPRDDGSGGLVGLDLSGLLTKQGHDKKLLIVASDLEPPLLRKVAGVCERLAHPLVVVHSYGLLGVVRLQSPPLPLMNPKPRDSPPDLRLVHPFESLKALAASIQWKELENHEHNHVPYPLILLHAADEWKKQHQPRGQLPSAFVEKQEFQSTVPALSRNFNMEMNFQEAKKNAYLAYTERELDLKNLASVRDAATTSCPALLALLDGLDAFLKKHDNQPPLQGNIPDMTASTDLYVNLQKIYREQADKDLAEMRALVPVSVSDEELSTFCQNVFHLDLLKTRTLEEEFSQPIPEEVAEDIAMSTMEGDERPDQIPMLLYIAFRACQLFYEQNGRYPGVTDDYAEDVKGVQQFIVKVVKAYNLQENDVVKDTLLKSEDYATEVTRYGNAEIHNIASVVGGVASQEAVKIITGQYVPFNNTYVYNGIASTGAVYNF